MLRDISGDVADSTAEEARKVQNRERAMNECRYVELWFGNLIDTSRYYFVDMFHIELHWLLSMYAQSEACASDLVLNSQSCDAAVSNLVDDISG